MKKYAFFDLDGTLYDGYTTSAFYLFLVKKKLAPDSVIGEHKEMLDQFHSGKIEYREVCERILNLAARVLKGQDEETVNGWIRMFFEEEGKFCPWVESLLKTLKEKEFKFFLISGTMKPFADLVAVLLGIEKTFSSEFEIENGIYTGKVKSILHFEAKKKLVSQLVEDMKDSEKIGFGDSTGDVEMLSSMNVSFVYKPFEKNMIEISNEKGWNIVDENNILEIVEAKI
jgi:HAD superfamily hydrolase (TIGR01490 family)